MQSVLERYKSQINSRFITKDDNLNTRWNRAAHSNDQTNEINSLLLNKKFDLSDKTTSSPRLDALQDDQQRLHCLSSPENDVNGMTMQVIFPIDIRMLFNKLVDDNAIYSMMNSMSNRGNI